MDNLKYGGFYKPRDSIPTELTAIIVPYRDRADHLEKFLAHLHPFLQEQHLQYGVYVVEMVSLCVCVCVCVCVSPPLSLSLVTASICAFKRSWLHHTLRFPLYAQRGFERHYMFVTYRPVHLAKNDP